MGCGRVPGVHSQLDGANLRSRESPGQGIPPPPMTRTALLLALLAVSALGACTTTSPRATPSTPDPRPALLAVLDAQVRAWNAGDIRGFMDGYWRSDSLRFASGGTVRRGWQAALDGYLRGYPTREAMGTLAFSDLEVTGVTPASATVFGRWQLTYAAGTPHAGGLFTLGFRRFGTDWRIVSDHTSSNSR